MSKICGSVFGWKFSCCKPALLALEIPTVKDWDLGNPYLWATTFGVGNIHVHNAVCTSFVQKYTFNTKAGIV